MSTQRSRVEKYIGRELLTEMKLFTKHPEYKFSEDVEEVVHHIDGDRSNNEKGLTLSHYMEESCSYR